MQDIDAARATTCAYLIAVTVATEVPPTAPEAEFRAVIDVMRNRAKSRQWSGPAATGDAALLYVVLAKNQFSAVCREDYWRRAIAGDWLPAHVARCAALLAEQWPDTTNGALYYYSPVSMPSGRAPEWAARMTETHPVGTRHEYFRFFRP